MRSFRRHAVLPISLIALVATGAGVSIAGTAGGAPDTSLAGTGEVESNVAATPCTKAIQSCSSYANAVAVDSQGRIVVAGSRGTDGVQHAKAGVVRYMPDGTLDTTFSGDGKERVKGSYASSLAIDPQDRIVLGGLGIVRLKEGGGLDTSFSGDGRIDKAAVWISTDSSGRVLVAKTQLPDYGLSVRRYLVNGQPDPAFHPDAAYIGDGAFAYAVETDSQGRILVAGLQTNDPDDIDDRGALARFNSDGSLDTSFGNGGTVRSAYGGVNEYLWLRVDDEDRIVAGGDRYLPDGTVDEGFGNGGSLEHGGIRGTIDGQGRIITSSGVRMNNRLYRYLPDGQPDASFGGDGEVRTGFADISYIATDQTDRVVTTGRKRLHPETKHKPKNFFTERFLGD